MAFPRLNALSYWLFLGAGLLHLRRASSSARRRTPAGSTTCRSRCSRYDRGLNVDFYALGLIFNGIASTVGAINLIVTIFKLRAPGMSLNRMPLFCFAMLAASLSLDLRAAGADGRPASSSSSSASSASTSSTSAHGGDPLLWQHLFWIFGHPEVYIIVLPAFGIATSIIPTFARRQDGRVPARRDGRAARRVHRLRRLGAPHVRDRAHDDDARLLRRRLDDGRDPVDDPDLRVADDGERSGRRSSARRCCSSAASSSSSCSAG